MGAADKEKKNEGADWEANDKSTHKGGRGKREGSERHGDGKWTENVHSQMKHKKRDRAKKSILWRKGIKNEILKSRLNVYAEEMLQITENCFIITQLNR